MEGKEESKASCCPSGAPCGASASASAPTRASTVLDGSKPYCKCGPGWNCVITKLDEPDSGEPFANCSPDSCVCVFTNKPEKKAKAEGGIAVETEGAYCYCPKGYTCTVTKVEGTGSGQAFFECGNGCQCEIPGDAISVTKIGS